MGGFPKEKQKFYTEFMPSLLAPTRVVTSSHAREHQLLTSRNRISRYLLRAIKRQTGGRSRMEVYWLVMVVQVSFLVVR